MGEGHIQVTHPRYHGLSNHNVGTRGIAVYAACESEQDGENQRGPE